MYDVNAMKQAIKQCDVNIKTFEEAINKERETKSEYTQVVARLEAEAKVNGNISSQSS